MNRLVCRSRRKGKYCSVKVKNSSSFKLEKEEKKKEKQVKER